MGRTPARVSRETHGHAERLIALCESMGVALHPEPAEILVELAAALLAEPQNLTGVRSMDEAVERHLADSLSALTLPEFHSASTILDLGSGGGFPGFALAATLPGSEVTLVESERRKADWLRRASGQFPNVRVVAERSETLALTEREGWDLVCARAVAPPPVTLELAAPLVGVGGHAALWLGGDGSRRDSAAGRAATELGFASGQAHPTRPFPGADRHIALFAKRTPTDPGFPRRPGRAAKRPLA